MFAGIDPPESVPIMDVLTVETHTEFPEIIYRCSEGHQKREPFFEHSPDFIFCEECLDKLQRQRWKK
jgi:hypothetical protein